MCGSCLVFGEFFSSVKALRTYEKVKNFLYSITTHAPTWTKCLSQIVSWKIRSFCSPKYSNFEKYTSKNCSNNFMLEPTSIFLDSYQSHYFCSLCRMPEPQLVLCRHNNKHCHFSPGKNSWISAITSPSRKLQKWLKKSLPAPYCSSLRHNFKNSFPNTCIMFGWTQCMKSRLSGFPLRLSVTNEWANTFVTWPWHFSTIT